jgi:DNA-binding NarL/FixJ family response regulator
VKRRAKQVAPPSPDAIVTITENQRQILLRLFAGRLEPEIAAETGRKPSTIFNTVRRVRDRLGARSNYHFVYQCLRRRIVTLDEIDIVAARLEGSQSDPAGGSQHG